MIGTVAQNSAWLEASMTRLGLSRADMAKLCGVAHRTVDNWRSGRNRPPERAVGVIAQVERYVSQQQERLVAAWQEAGQPEAWVVPLREEDTPAEMLGPRRIAALLAAHRITAWVTLVASPGEMEAA